MSAAARVLAWVGALAVAAVEGLEAVARARLLDARVPAWSAWVCGAALAGVALALLLARLRPQAWARLDGERLAWCALVACLALGAAARVAPDADPRVLREALPPWLGPLAPLLAGLVPLGLARGARRADAGEQGLRLALGLCTAGGALLALEGGGALLLASLALWGVLARGPVARPRGALALVAALTVAALGLATLLSPARLDAVPALRWVAAFALLGLALAVRPRAWRDAWPVLAAPVRAACAVALCGLVVHVGLARVVGLEPALRTRTQVLGLHANFLAALFVVHLPLAIGLAGAARGAARAGWRAAAALLLVGTLLTGSRAGLGAALVAGAVLLLASGVAARWRAGAWRARRPRVALLLVVALVAGGALVAGNADALRARLAPSIAYRAEAWENSLALVARRPWRGLGPGVFETVTPFAPGSRFDMEPSAPHPHSVPLYLAQAAGLPGAAAGLAWTLLLLAGLARELARRRPAERSRRVGALDPRAHARSAADVAADTDSHGPAVARALLAACTALVVVDLVDVGLALHTVLPTPLFVFSGVLLAARAARPVGRGAEHGAPGAELPDARSASAAPGARLAAAGLALPALLIGLAAHAARAAEHGAFTAQVRAGVLRAPVAGAAPEQPALDAARALERAAAARLLLAVRLDPFRRTAYERLAGMRRAPDPAAVRAALADQLAHAPRDARALALRGRFERDRGHPEEARRWLQRALDAGPGGRRQSADRAALVELLAELGERDAARDALARAVERDVDVLQHVRWNGARARHALRLGGGASEADGRAPELTLAETLDALEAEQRAALAAGRPVGRDFRMATYHARRLDGDLARAAALLEELDAGGEVDPESVARERARLAEDAGDLAAAERWFLRAHELSGRGWFAGQAARVAALRAAGGAAVPGAPATRGPDAAAAGARAEVLAQPTAFRDALEQRLGAAPDAAARARAADALVFFCEPLRERADALLRASRAWLAAGRPRAALERARRACELLRAPAAPVPAELGWLAAAARRERELAHALLDAWRALGLDRAARRAAVAALDTPCALAAELPHLAWQLHAESADPAAVLAVDARLHAVPGLRWWRLDALEALGRGAELRAEFAAAAQAARAAGLEPTLQARLAELPAAEIEAALDTGRLALLLGRPEHAASAFARALQAAPDAHAAAHVHGWSARLESLRPQGADAAAVRAALDAGLARFPDCDALAARRAAYAGG